MKTWKKAQLKLLEIYISLHIPIFEHLFFIIFNDFTCLQIWKKGSNILFHRL